MPMIPTVEPLSALKRLPRNAKAHALTDLRSGMKRFGFLERIIINDTTGHLIAGHGRVDALTQLKRLGREIPENITVGETGDWLVPADHVQVPEDQEEAAALALNQLTMAGGWNEDLLLAVLSDVAESPGGLAGVGFTDDDLEAMKTAAKKAAPPEDPGAQLDRADELQAVWGTKRGQVWVIPSGTCPEEEHRLMCGDSTVWGDVAKLMQNRQARFMWTDPPYGVEYVGKTADKLTIAADTTGDVPSLLNRAWACADRALVEGAPIYIAEPSGSALAMFIEAALQVGWHWQLTLVWVKDTMVMGRMDYQVQHEFIFYGWKGVNRFWYGGRKQKSVLFVDRPSRSAEHPTMKPPALVTACIDNSSRPGDIGYEPFSGSGSTMVACEQGGRICYAMEVLPEYVAVGLQRMQDMGLVPRLEEVQP